MNPDNDVHIDLRTIIEDERNTFTEGEINVILNEQREFIRRYTTQNQNNDRIPISEGLEEEDLP